MNTIGGRVVGCPAFRRNLKDNEESQFIQFLNFLNGINIQDKGEDARVWEALKNGSFSVSSFFKAFLNNSRERSTVCSIWKLKAPPRVLVFERLALGKRIPTMNFLRRRGMTIMNGFPMCLRYEESVDHLMQN